MRVISRNPPASPTVLSVDGFRLAAGLDSPVMPRQRAENGLSYP